MDPRAAAEALRTRIGVSIFDRVAGSDGPRQREVINTDGGERWFAEDSPVRRVHGDSSMFVGGLRALLLHSLHPLAMAAVAEHSDYRGDPWGRLQRTSYFLAVTTYGRAQDAQQAVDRPRTAGRTPRPTRTCSTGCTWPRWTASCGRTPGSGRSR
jgi:uncharacterized protein (DUF2236 family)